MQSILRWLKENRYVNIYLTGLLLFSVGLPLSKTAMSLALILLSAHWLLSEGYRKFPHLKSPRGTAFAFFMLIVFIHLAGLFYTSDFTYAFKDLRIKLPLLLLPLFTLTSPPLTGKQVSLVLKTFIAAVLAGSFITLFILIVRNPVEPRDLTPFVSHIRFSMMVCLSVFASFHLALKKNEPMALRWLLAFISVWLMIFLIILESLTGVMAFILILVVMLIRMIMSHQRPILRITGALTLIILTVAGIILVHLAKREFVPDLHSAAQNLTTHTEQGSPYFHDTTSLINENGHLVWLYVCEPEMREAWNRRSSLGYDSLRAPDSKTGDVLMRYLSSKGLKKDASGVNALTDSEIKKIERGITNYRYGTWTGMRRRFDQLKWEYWNYRGGGDPRGYSLMQRLELWRIGWSLALENLPAGVGTGDVLAQFIQHSIEIGSPLAGTKMRSHNQYITILITFGIPGSILFLTGIIVPLFFRKRRIGFIFLSFLIIALFSMLMEDTLETQVGVSFFAFFYAFCLFQKRKEEDEPYEDRSLSPISMPHNE